MKKEENYTMHFFSLLYSVLQVLTASDKRGKHLQITQQYKLQKNKIFL